MLFKPVIPKEHGAWAVLLVPLFIGVQVGGGIDWYAVSFVLSSLGVFLSYLPTQILLRNAFGLTQNAEKLREAQRWVILYFAAALVFILPIFLIQGRWLLLPIGVVGVGSFLVNFFLTRKQQKTIVSDLAAVIGLTLTAPSAYYVVSGQLDQMSLVLWVLNVLFFGSCVFYVHMRIKALAVKKAEWGWKDRLTYGGINLVYHVVMIALLLLLALNRLTPLLALLAFAPITINALWGTMRLASEANLRRVGFGLLTHSLAFMLLSLLLLR